MNKILVLSYYHPFVAGGGHRPHQFLLEDLKRGREVVFLFFSSTETEQISSLASSEIYQKLAIYQLDFTLEKNLIPYSTYASKQISEYSNISDLISKWKPNYARAHNPVAAFIPLIEKLKDASIAFIYDQMDMWSAFSTQPWGDDSIEQYYFENSNAVTTVSNFLLAKVPKYKKAYLLENAISDAFFDALSLYKKNNNNFKTNGRDKHFLYMGAMWPDWFDWNLAYYLAERRPEYKFTYIGSVIASTDENDGRRTKDFAEKLRSYPNVNLLDEVPHMSLIKWLKEAEIGIIPFIVNDITLACSPLKVFEYIGAGLPIVSTALPEIENYPLVVTGSNYDSILKCCDEVNTKVSLETRKMSERFIASNTWKHRVDLLDALIEEL